MVRKKMGFQMVRKVVNRLIIFLFISFLSSCEKRVSISEDLFFRNYKYDLCRYDHKADRQKIIIKKPWLVKNGNDYDDITYNSFKNLIHYNNSLYFKSIDKIGKVNLSTNISEYINLDTKVTYYSIRNDKLYYSDDYSIYEWDYLTNKSSVPKLFFKSKHKMYEFSIGNQHFAVNSANFCRIYNQDKDLIKTFDKVLHHEFTYNSEGGFFFEKSLKGGGLSYFYFDFKTTVEIPLEKIFYIKALKNGDILMVQDITGFRFDNIKYYRTLLFKDYSVKSFLSEKLNYGLVFNNHEFRLLY